MCNSWQRCISMQHTGKAAAIPQLLGMISVHSYASWEPSLKLQGVKSTLIRCWSLHPTMYMDLHMAECNDFAPIAPHEEATTTQCLI